jgi:hypothetical protein
MSTRFSPRLKHKEIVNRINEVIKRRIWAVAHDAQMKSYRLYLAEHKYDFDENHPEIVVRRQQHETATSDLVHEIRCLRAMMSLYDYYGLDEFKSYKEVIDFKLKEMQKDW